MDLTINVEETKESVVRRQIHVNDVKSSGGLSFEESHETDQKNNKMKTPKQIDLKKLEHPLLNPVAKIRKQKIMITRLNFQ